MAHQGANKSAREKGDKTAQSWFKKRQTVAKNRRKMQKASRRRNR